jgi:hypothetical protein
LRRAETTEEIRERTAPPLAPQSGGCGRHRRWALGPAADYWATVVRSQTVEIAPHPDVPAGEIL